MGMPSIGDDGSEYIALGASLREIREAQGLSYEDIDRATHMRPFIIRAIEEGHVDTIGAPVYVRGFVRSYCDFLKADDIWKRYSTRLTLLARQPETEMDPDGYSTVTEPRPVFRRATFVWVYILLIAAVAGVSYLLWMNHSNKEGEDENGFYLQPTSSQRSDERVEDWRDPTSDDGVISMDVVAEPMNGEGVSEEAPQHDEIGSADVAHPVQSATPSVDLSWLDGSDQSAGVQPHIDSVITDVPDTRLIIELRGPSGLVVKQDGSVLTRRQLLAAGSSRSYDVTSAITVELTSGSGADITWYGRRYQSVGSGDHPLTLTFFPDGSVKLGEGESRHFGR